MLFLKRLENFSNCWFHWPNKYLNLLSELKRNCETWSWQHSWDRWTGPKEQSKNFDNSRENQKHPKYELYWKQPKYWGVLLSLDLSCKPPVISGVVSQWNISEFLRLNVIFIQCFFESNFLIVMKTRWWNYFGFLFFFMLSAACTWEGRSIGVAAYSKLISILSSQCDVIIK